MTFENLCKIIDGVRLNNPSVNAYEKIETKPHLIKRGDLFVGNNQNDITLAIENGAYGIVSQQCHITDEEVSWIEVSSTDETLIKILRFSLLKSSASFFLFSSIEYALIKQIAKKEKLIFLEKEPAKNFKKILEAKCDAFFISDSQTFLEQIYPDYITYHDRLSPLIKLTHQTLFLSSFTYDDIHYEDIKLPALFLKPLNVVLHYFNDYKLQFDIEKLHFLETFKPLFISDRLTIRPFGHSEHAFIVIDNKVILEEALCYIQGFATWADTLLFLPKSEETLAHKNGLVHYYEDIEEVKKIEVDKFNFILILANYNELSLILENNKQEKNPSLF